MRISRREWSALACGAIAGRAFGQRKIPIAVQLYSVRQIAARDTAGVLAQIAALGYQGVEFAGYYGHSAADLKKTLDQCGLKAAGSHVGLEALLGDKLAETMEFNRTIGNKNLIVPGLPGKYRSSIAGWKEAGKLFSEIAAKAKGEGFTIGYHNHTLEFHAMEGEMPFDAFFGAASPEVKVQLDIGHAAGGGADPVEVIRRYRGRIVSAHVKDYSPAGEVTVGDGVVKWNEVFRNLESSPGLEWYIVEEEGSSCKGTECIQKTIGVLHRMGK